MDPSRTEDTVCSLDDARIIGADPYLETYLDHPEDVAVAADGTLYAGGEDGQIYHVNPDTNEVVQIASTGGFTLCLTLGPEEETL
ncbi:hypothetical protein, partial [Haloferax marisrubri]|uniref:hypothetical protein n=1 Tax=Haloferax marisrubri TaxID=1544719 RepID=UPI0018EDCE89